MAAVICNAGDKKHERPGYGGHMHEVANSWIAKPLHQNSPCRDHLTCLIEYHPGVTWMASGSIQSKSCSRQ